MSSIVMFVCATVASLAFLVGLCCFLVGLAVDMTAAISAQLDQRRIFGFQRGMLMGSANAVTVTALVCIPTIGLVLLNDLAHWLSIK